MIAQLKRNDAGSIVLIAAFSLAMFIMFVNLAVNISRAYRLQAAMSQAADAAATAGALEYTRRDGERGTNGLPRTERARRTAQKYYRANISQERSTITDEDIGVDEATGQVNVQPVSTIPVYFRLLPRLNVAVNAVAIGNLPEPDKITEIAMVLDVTTSMAKNGKMQGMKEAASLLVREVMDTNPNALISLVPFNITVRFDTRYGYDRWLDTDHARLRDRAASFNRTEPVEWGGCIMNNLQPNDATDTVWKQRPLLPLNSDLGVAESAFNLSEPLSLAQHSGTSSANPLLKYVNDERTNENATGQPKPPGGGNRPNIPLNPQPPKPTTYYPEGYCTPPAIMPLTDNKDSLLAHINSFDLQGYGNVKKGTSGTIGQFGMLWGWRSLSPQWKNEWFTAPNGHPMDYGDDGKKALVFLTDGLSEMPFGYANPNNPDQKKWIGFGAYGYTPGHHWYPDTAEDYDWNKYGFNLNPRTYADLFQADLVLDDRMRKVCYAIRQTAITTYVIGFDVLGQPGGAARADKLLAYCATNPSNYFLAATNDQLQEVFRDIAKDILFDANVRLIE